MEKRSRRNFVKLTGLGAISFMAARSVTAGTTIDPTATGSLKLGLASYSLRKFTLAQTLEMTKRAGLEYICLKSMHLPLEDTAAELKAGAEEVKNAGLVLYAGGVIYMKSEAEVDQAFEYAKNAGMPMIIGVPNHDLLDYTNTKIKEYNIRVAIHNHGPGGDVYPSPESVYDKIKNLDPRFGLCMDIGHTQRIGVDPSEAAKKYFDRLFDIHIKDVTEATSEGVSTEIGRGVIDIPKFLKTLTELKYSGVVALEYEKDADDPMPGLCESVGYLKGCLAAMC
jgi:inosose dehydratase